MRYNKLVRDKIPAVIKRNGQVPVTHKASEVEFRNKLLEKLEEEVKEFLNSMTEELATEELADILEIVKNIGELIYGVDWLKLEKLRQKKAAARGGFEKRIILDEVK